MISAAPLDSQGAAWPYPVDQAHAVETSADAARQTTVHIRFRQRQGIEILVRNDSDWTQVILGLGPNFQPFSAEPLQVTVQTGPDLNEYGIPLSGSAYVQQGAIPPHSTRFVHVTWTSDVCSPSSIEGIIDWVPLRVRVGVITKTEVIPLLEGFGIQGPTPGKCP
jgi:hypothetical protein